ncbi:cell wall elongation regulator TseB-like domain-containing protein [Paenibacillus eucommiae]|nr:DUF5590 domain-containing protein [Paenibacillus eucommiae]
MTWKRNLIITVFILGTLIFVLSRFYINVQSEYWSEESKAVQTAYAKSALKKASKVEAFYGDKPLQIISGEDENGEQIFVWVAGEEVHVEKAADAASEQQIRDTMKQKDPALELMRVMPGLIEGKYVWEVFYKKKEASGTRYYYDYYHFHDGSFIDTYRLSLQ